MARAVDEAMDEDRPEKRTIRSLWADRLAEVDALHPGARDVPLYLTLPGAHGRDIDVVAERGIVRLTDTNAIAAEDLDKLVAIESGGEAVLALQTKFPGLTILDRRVADLLRSTGLTRWPQGRDETRCRARVVNLDLNTGLRAELEQGQLTFPMLRLVQKLALLHAKEPQVDWSLYLTLDARLEWTEAVQSSVNALLASNFGRVASFARATEALFGEGLFRAVEGHGARSSAPQLSPTDRQKLLMAVVPKKIALDAHGHGWRVVTRQNLRYGGAQGHAPMVTWIFDFWWDSRAGAQPDAVYHESVAEVLAAPGEIVADGSVR